jgi:CheY-like chemotaxis protein
MDQATFSQAAAQLTRGQLLDLLLDVEDRLKSLIRAVFAKERENWEALIPRTVRSQLAEATSTATPLLGPSADLLDRATLKQLIDILLAQWKLFQPILDDKAWVQATLDEIRKARNSLAHGAQPKPDDKVKIALAAAELSKRIPMSVEAMAPQPAGTGRHLFGCRVLWVDDVPEGNTWSRQLLRSFGAEVVPVLTNDEAVLEANRRLFHVVVSDIDRQGAEPGSQLGVRLKAAGLDIPIIFYISHVDHSLPLPFGAVLITNDRVSMLTCVLSLLRPDAVAETPS